VYRFDCQASLLRIAQHKHDVDAMHVQANTESRLLHFYGASLPAPCAVQAESVPSDSVSVAVLQQHNAWLLSRYMPAYIAGDGNCLFRAVSMALYGTERHHVLLRLLAAIEVCVAQQLYDTQAADLYSPFANDVRLVLPAYGDFLRDLVTTGTYSDMLSVLALSAVVQKPIQTLHLVSTRPGEQSPVTKLVVGRDVTNTRHPVYILWTALAFTPGQPVNCNHFVPLLERELTDDTATRSVVDLTDAGAAANYAFQPEQVIGDYSDNSARTQAFVNNADNAACDHEFAASLFNWNPTRVLNGSFLPRATVLDLLQTPTDIVDIVPSGPKNNVVFVLHDEDNRVRAQTARPNAYWDDCGAWTDRRTWTSHHLIATRQELRLVDGQFCVRKRVDGKRITVPLSVQPSADDVLTVHQFYARLKRDVSYQKRVTWLDTRPYAVVEYLGAFPNPVVPHGNAAYATGEYVRTKPQVLDNLRATVSNSKLKPRAVYSQMQTQTAADDHSVRNLQQVQHMSSACTKADRAARGQTASGNNLADDILELCNRISAGDHYVRAVTLTPNHAPICILHTDDQIRDIRRFCSSDAPDAVRSVLGVNRTFNLASLFVTVTVFRHRAVVRTRSQDAPIFLGPVMLHGDGQFKTYLRFFSHLYGELNCDVGSTELQMSDSIMTGSDEEKSLVKALRAGMPSNQHLYCALHTRDNLRQQMTRLGVAQATRERIVALTFGSDGVSTAPDQASFDHRVSALMQFVRQATVPIVDYLQDRTLPKLQSNCTLLWQNAWLGQHAWNNNNSESMNNILKITVDWKPARVADLVDHLHDLVKLQYADLRRAVFGQGDYQLAPKFTQHYVPAARWHSMKDETRDRRFRQFMDDNGTVVYVQ